MKNITTILLLCIGCLAYGQTPDTHCYSQEYVDSVISHYEARIWDCYSQDTIDVYKDYVYFRLRDGESDNSGQVIELTKINKNFWFNFIDLDNNDRINSNYVDGESQSFIK